MPGKPTEQEDEYFARLEFERQRKIDPIVTEDAGLFGSVRRIFS